MSSEETLAWARGTGTGVSEGLSCSPGPIFPGLFVRSSELSAGSGGKTGSTPLAGRGSGWRCPSRWPRAAPVGAEAGSLTWPRGRLLCRSAPLGAGSCKGVARVEGPGAFPLFPSPVQSCCLPPLQPGVVPCSLFPPSLTGEPSGAALGPAAPSETASPRPGSELSVSHAGSGLPLVALPPPIHWKLWPNPLPPANVLPTKSQRVAKTVFLLLLIYFLTCRVRLCRGSRCLQRRGSGSGPFCLAGKEALGLGGWMVCFCGFF